MRGREVADGQGQGGAGRGGGEPAQVVVVVMVMGGGGQVLLGEAHRTAAVAATTGKSTVIAQQMVQYRVYYSLWTTSFMFAMRKSLLS